MFRRIVSSKMNLLRFLSTGFWPKQRFGDSKRNLRKAKREQLSSKQITSEEKLSWKEYIVHEYDCEFYWRRGVFCMTSSVLLWRTRASKIFLFNNGNTAFLHERFCASRRHEMTYKSLSPNWTMWALGANFQFFLLTSKLFKTKDSL